jgi:hypothetical protein
MKKLTFGEAIQALKQGYEVRRSGWNGKGMYLWLLKSVLISEEPHLKALAEANGEALGSIRMRTDWEILYVA